MDLGMPSAMLSVTANGIGTCMWSIDAMDKTVAQTAELIV